jgi:hypothetical protein
MTTLWEGQSASPLSLRAAGHPKNGGWHGFPREDGGRDEAEWREAALGSEKP